MDSSREFSPFVTLLLFEESEENSYFLFEIKSTSGEEEPDDLMRFVVEVRVLVESELVMEEAEELEVEVELNTPSLTLKRD